MKSDNKRFKWKTPADQELELQLTRFNEELFLERVERLRVLSEEFGPPRDMVLWGGIPAIISLEEMKLAFIEHLDLSVITNAHIFLEQTLGSHLILSGHEKEAEKGLGKIIEKSLELGAIDKDTSERLHKLRAMRVAYSHSHSGVKERSYIKRYLDSEHSDSWELLKTDALDAVKIVVDLLRFQNPDWRPKTEVSSVENSQ